MAIAFNGATLTRGPFTLFTEQNFGFDKRTRIMLFVLNIESDASNISVHAQNSTLGSVSLPVEFVGKVPGFDWLTQVKVALPDSLAHAGDVSLRVVSNGMTSNHARISIGQSIAAALTTKTPKSPMGFVDWWITPRRQLAWWL